MASRDDDLPADTEGQPAYSGELPAAPEVKVTLPPHPARKSQGEEPQTYARMAMAAQAGGSFTAPIVIFALAGIWIDNRFHHGPMGVFGGVVLGFIVGLNLLINVTKKLGD